MKSIIKVITPVATCLILVILCFASLAVLANKVTRLQDDDDTDLDRFTTQLPNALVKISNNKKRDLGLLALKAILLGPIIGLTIKAALIRGLIWAVLAYGLHLFFPALLGTFGLGTGLVGFARQLRPDYNQMFITYFLNLLQTLPMSVSGLTGQYHQMIAPIVEAIRSIPEGHCRYRAVCETASHLVRNVRSVSSSLQRISATVYMNFGNEYSKAWLDGIVQSECAVKYSQCLSSPFSMVAARLAQTLGQGHMNNLAGSASAMASTAAPGPLSTTGQLAAAIAAESV